MSDRNPKIIALDRAEITVAPWRWDFARARAEEIAGHFAARQRKLPTLWNGRVLLMHRFTVDNGVLRGASFETDYASFLAWRDWGRPEVGVFNVFAAAALQAGDGAYLIGRMAPSTSIAGTWLFPCGTPDPKDVSAGMLDLAGSARRELFEETGLELGAMQAEAGWTLVHDGSAVALIKRVTVSENAEDLRTRIVAHLANEAEPEFSEIRILRNSADANLNMPNFLRAYLAWAWS
jgi:8-oxo-dGTP pyrophosphatase MutT (NUDIX family)